MDLITFGQLALAAAAGGFVVSLLTGFIIGRPKARMFPGGSLMVGLTTGLQLNAGAFPVVIVSYCCQFLACPNLE